MKTQYNKCIICKDKIAIMEKLSICFGCLDKIQHKLNLPEATPNTKEFDNTVSLNFEFIKAYVLGFKSGTKE